MIEKKSKVASYIIILLLVLCCGISGVAVHYKLEADNYQKNAEANHKFYSYQELEAKNTIENAFLTLFNYDNSNFVSRFTEAKKYMNDDIVMQQQGSGEIQVPEVKVQKKVDSIKIYRELNEANNISALVQLQSTYSVDGKENPSVNELYRVRLNLKSHKIDSFEYLGALNILKNS